MKETRHRRLQRRRSETRLASKVSATGLATRNTRPGRARPRDIPTRTFTGRGTADPIVPNHGPITPIIRRRNLPSTPDRIPRGPIPRSRNRYERSSWIGCASQPLESDSIRRARSPPLRVPATFRRDCEIENYSLATERRRKEITRAFDSSYSSLFDFERGSPRVQSVFNDEGRGKGRDDAAPLSKLNWTNPCQSCHDCGKNHDERSKRWQIAFN